MFSSLLTPHVKIMLLIHFYSVEQINLMTYLDTGKITIPKTIILFQIIFIYVLGKLTRKELKKIKKISFKQNYVLILFYFLSLNFTSRFVKFYWHNINNN